jgi:hypothetical protein
LPSSATYILKIGLSKTIVFKSKNSEAKFGSVRYE